MSTVDYIVVGQGLAGSLLAWQLIQQGQEIIVIDNQQRDCASAVATGIINPITGKRLTKSWQLDTTWPIAQARYAELGRHFNASFTTSYTTLRLLKSPQEQTIVVRREQDPAYSLYLDNHYAPNHFSPTVNDGYGSVAITPALRLHTQALLAHIRAFLLGSQRLILEPFAYDGLHIPQKTHLTYRQWTARGVIFCEGFQVRDNPWFQTLPWAPAKGEILTVKDSIPDYPDRHIVNRGHWVLPDAGNRFHIGATYSWESLDSKPTTAGRRTLLKSWQQLLPQQSSPQVLGHSAGIRPCSRDARPILGQHPRHPQLHIFNGFGSKGALLIPYYAQRMADKLIADKALPAAVDRQRFARAATGV